MPEVYDVTDLVGNLGTERDRVAALATLLYRTVDPAQWFAQGGLSTIQAFYNPVKKKWRLSVNSSVPRADFQKVLDQLNAP